MIIVFKEMKFSQFFLFYFSYKYIQENEKTDCTGLFW